jgi:UPF0271 protein
MTLVLDSGAFINDSSLDCGDEECFTVHEVIDELKDFKSKQLAEAALSSGKLKTSFVNPISLILVKNIAQEVGSLEHLSETDLKVIALAVQLNAKVITDDFTVQNLCAHIGLKYEGVLRGKIRRKKKF